MLPDSCFTVFRYWKDHPWWFPYCIANVSERIFTLASKKNGGFFWRWMKVHLFRNTHFTEPETPVILTLHCPKTSRNPSSRSQHLHGNSKSETQKTPSHLITRPWTIVPWILGPQRFFFPVQAPKHSTSSTAPSDIVCKMQPAGSGSLCTDRAAWGWGLF